MKRLWAFGLSVLAGCTTMRDEPALRPVPPSALRVSAGRVEPVGASLSVRGGGMRAEVRGRGGRSAELAFVYLGPGDHDVPLANGELRRQIGLKLLAEDTCNVIYVMWHLEPDAGVRVSVKRNPGMSTHAECGDRGYVNVAPARGERVVAAPGARHVLRAELVGRTLRVDADGVRAWEGALPPEADALSGPAGVRSDNGAFVFELSTPDGDAR